MNYEYKMSELQSPVRLGPAAKILRCGSWFSGFGIQVQKLGSYLSILTTSKIMNGLKQLFLDQLGGGEGKPPLPMLERHMGKCGNHGILEQRLMVGKPEL